MRSPRPVQRAEAAREYSLAAPHRSSSAGRPITHCSLAILTNPITASPACHPAAPTDLSNRCPPVRRRPPKRLKPATPDRKYSLAPKKPESVTTHARRQPPGATTGTSRASYHQPSGAPNAEPRAKPGLAPQARASPTSRPDQRRPRRARNSMGAFVQPDMSNRCPSRRRRPPKRLKPPPPGSRYSLPPQGAADGEPHQR